LKRLELFIDPKSTTFPSCIYELENLSVLNLSLENLTQIPDGISQLSSLKKLTISASNNGGFKYPTDITKLTNLTYLKLNTYTVTPDFIKEKMSPILKMGWD